VLVGLILAGLVAFRPFGGSAPSGAPATFVRFDAPLAVGSSDIDGKSLAQLIAGAPAFPPVDGMPAETWQGKLCASCHAKEWTKATLCEQGRFYIKAGEARRLSVNHPFGHAFSAALRNWAENDCL
jgi:hypothetical protein